jgi:hypothetical protein
MFNAVTVVCQWCYVASADAQVDHNLLPAAIQTQVRIAIHEVSLLSLWCGTVWSAMRCSRRVIVGSSHNALKQFEHLHVVMAASCGIN